MFEREIPHDRLLFPGFVSWFLGAKILHGPVDDTAADPDARTEVLVSPSVNRLGLPVHPDRS